MFRKRPVDASPRRTGFQFLLVGEKKGGRESLPRVSRIVRPYEQADLGIAAILRYHVTEEVSEDRAGVPFPEFRCGERLGHVDPLTELGKPPQ
jgi:hypothetical protein